MSEIGLSVLAIAIFTITMTALLGPVVGISPLVPTGVTVLLLGLYGIDTAQWAGKGTSQLLTWLQMRSPAYKQRLLNHEAGHFLAAYLLGIKILDYRLEPESSLWAKEFIEAGVVVAPISINQLGDQTTYASLLERYCTVWMAGIAAEEFIYQSEATGGLNDIQQLKSATASLPNPELQQRWALLRARNLITTHQTAFKALVEEMQQNSTVEICCKAIDEALIK